MGSIKCILFSVEFIEATSQPRNITTDKTAKALWIITAEQNQVINIELSVVKNVGSSLSSSNILDYIKVHYLHNLAVPMKLWLLSLYWFMLIILNVGCINYKI